jgi:DNA ligase-1
MKRFAELIMKLATTAKTNAKLEAIRAYFSEANSEDKIWVIALFTGRRPKRSVNSALLRASCMKAANIDPWLFEECYHTVGDLAETISLLIPESDIDTKDVVEYSLSHYMNLLRNIGKKDDDVKALFVTAAWTQMNRSEIFVFNKLMTGGFRIGVSQKLMVNAIAKTTAVSPSIIAHRIMGDWNPATISFDELMSTEHSAADDSKPYPFYLAYALENEVNELGNENEWQAEWKWDGIRGQIIKRNDELFVWSRGEELMTDKFPEYKILQELLPNGTAIDGEIISLATPPVEGNFAPLPFSALQTRIGRKNITAKQLKEAPVGFIAYDIIEENGEDIRMMSMLERRKKLEEIINKINVTFLHLSPIINFNNWEELTTIRKQSRDMGSEGIMLKRKNSEYKDGRKRGDWWKWKIDPLTIDAVMIYAQKGSGRRSNLYTDYTFAVRDGDNLVTFAKAYSGLTDKEFAQVDNFVKRNSIEKFGPVRTVKPELIFELAFEGIAESKRHKSGVALRFPRMSRWRKDKKLQDINTLDDLKMMLKVFNDQYSSSVQNDTI